MARLSTITREAAIEAAIKVVREGGEGALSARNMGKALGCSVRPIFTLYDNMETLRLEVRKEAVRIFGEYVCDCVNYVPALKEYGMPRCHRQRLRSHGRTGLETDTIGLDSCLRPCDALSERRTEPFR